MSNEKIKSPSLQQLSDALPEHVSWMDELTPDIACRIWQAALAQQSEPAFITREQIAQEIESQIDGSKNSLFRSGMKISADIVRTEPTQVSQPVYGYLHTDGWESDLCGITNETTMIFEHEAKREVYLAPPDYEALKARVAELEAKVTKQADTYQKDIVKTCNQINYEKGLVVAERDKLQSELSAMKLKRSEQLKRMMMYKKERE